MKTPEGYKNLLVYKKSEQLMVCTHELTEIIQVKNLLALADQMQRSARSVKQNIVEGWKRNTTGEYIIFLGYAAASNAELQEDGLDISLGRYKELRGVKGVMGEKGSVTDSNKIATRDETVILDKTLTTAKTSTIDKSWTTDEINRLPFYPLPPFLPLSLQLFLRCKEVSFLLDKLMKALDNKRIANRELTQKELLQRRMQKKKDETDWLKPYLKS